jgi:hypothetical protein
MKAWVQVVSLVVCVFGAAPAASQPASSTAVALLPLDAESRLEIYGQPVASEIARALVVGGIDVVVVGPKMAVPDRARLILDGSIKADKGDAVTLSVRVRDRMTGMTLEKLEETATNLGTIDRAAAQLSSRVLPIVQRQLAALPPGPVMASNPSPGRVTEEYTRNVPKPPTVLVGVAVSRATVAEPLRVALGESLAAWVRDSRREPMPVDASTLDPKLVQVTVASAHAERALAFEILGYSVTGDRQVPLARARVRVRIADIRGIPFDRVVITDTIVGARNMPHDALAALVAREVLSILRPHMRKVAPQWR